MRSMAHIEEIVSLNPIDGADAIEVATILGWEVVVKKGEFKVGDKVVYCEIDSWIPVTVAPFLQKQTVRTYNGVEGEKLRTIKLRGQISQGLILPLPIDMVDLPLGHDLTEAFNIQKWEAPVSANLAGFAKGNFPSLIPKTDQERIQNIYGKIKRKIETGEIIDEWWIQEKLEGSSMQVAKVGTGEEFENHVCSRNLSLKLDQEGNTFVDTANAKRLIDAVNTLMNTNVFSLQGELIGEGIQGNIYEIKGHQFRLFDIYADNRYLLVPEIGMMIKTMSELGFQIDTVPMHKDLIKNMFTNSNSVSDLLPLAEIKSALNPKRDAEGIVVKNAKDPSITFKIINNKYLLKQKD